MRVLYITRKYPPAVGGMQRLSFQLVGHLKRYTEVRAITWGRSQWLLPWFLFRALMQGLVQAREVDLLHAGDPLVAPVVWLLGRLYHLPTVVNVHGLDLTFNFPGYQAFMPRLLRRFTRVVCISEATYAEALARGLAPERCRMIHPGADLPDQLPERSLARAYIASRLGISLNQQQVWLTVGRLVPRKGAVWFCEQVLPRLREATDFVYLIVGDGPEAARVRDRVARPDLAGRVFWLGRVSDAELHQLYAGADAFIMPNIPQPHDREGFGLVAVEAAMHHLPVIAARLEGIQDAVIEGKTGYLLPPAEAPAWADFLRHCLAEPQRLESLRADARAAVVERFGWDRMAQRYLDLYREIVQERL